MCTNVLAGAPGRVAFRDVRLAAAAAARGRLCVTPVWDADSRRAAYLTAATIGVCYATTLFCRGHCAVCQPETGKRHAGKTDAEFLQRTAARDGLGHCF